MGKFSKILLLIVIFLAGCNSGQDENMVKRESKIESVLVQNTVSADYSITRASNGVYVYTDRPKSTDINSLFITEEQTN